MRLKWFRARMSMKKKAEFTSSVGFYRSMSQFDSELPYTDRDGLGNSRHFRSMPDLNNPNYDSRSMHEDLTLNQKDQMSHSVHDMTESRSTDTQNMGLMSHEHPPTLKESPKAHMSDLKKKKGRAPVPTPQNRQDTQTPINSTRKIQNDEELQI